ncbi:MAG TPA: thioesterase domain-containing protein, partial [Ktedonobacteraceae bacterium]|nr:thioesterase domain-containing protein [Ktedonobacteraceae bacterium]
LRWMIPTGEALPVELSRRWLEQYPQIPLLNAYGPTECSDDVTHQVIDQPPDEGVRSVPIGKAVPNMRLYVLDRWQQPVPIGTSGELYVGGIGVGRGYLGDEERTRQAFLSDPFGGASGRLYRTGDLGRYLEDGALEFLGRRDQQVKIRGYRIELGEIEEVLRAQEGVRDVVVEVREDRPGVHWLVAYVVWKEGEKRTLEELKRGVKEQVPVYMVPGAFVELEALPLTGNGKVDRKALPEPERGSREGGETYVAARGEVERKLVGIWEEMLGVKPIGIRDDFFELGGDSLLAVRVFGRIEKACGKRVELSVLFGGATVERIAEEIEKGEEEHEETRAPVVPVQTGGSRRPFFYLHGEWRGVAYYTLELAKSLGPEQPFYLLEPYRFEGLGVPPTIEDMAAEHIKSMRRVQPEGPYQFGGWCNGALLAYEMARQLRAQGEAVDLLLLIDPDAPARNIAVRRTINRLFNLIQVNQEQQFNGFLRVQHIYRYMRFTHYRQTKSSQISEMLERGKAGKKQKKGIFASLNLKLNVLMPKIEMLRQDYLNLYDWSVSGYAPDLYIGKMVIFWTSEEPWRQVGWQKAVQAKDEMVEVYMLPGNHITSRTEHLPVLAERVRTCLNVAQTASIK